MGMNNNLKKANFFRRTSIYLLSIIGGLAFGFALISGAEDYGGGLSGILKNSPNALPWLSLLLLVLLAWKRELVGGMLITLFGLTLLYFFNFSGPNFFWSTFVLTLFIPILGLFLILSWYLRRSINNKI
jgi:hypothetical protein